MKEEKLNIKKTLKSIIDGTYPKEIILKNIGFILFLVFLSFIYIGNRNYTEKIERENIKLQKEIEELKSEQLTVTSILMRISQQSQVESLIVKHNLDLINSETQPYKLLVKCQK
jgi:hypothetical protein